MALINCPECGKQVSDKAKCCPNCGLEIANITDLTKASISTNLPRNEISNEIRKPNRWLVPLIVIIAVLASLSIVWFFLVKEKKVGEEAVVQVEASTEFYKGDKCVVIDGTQLRLRLSPSTDSETFKWKDGSNRHPKKGEKFKFLGETADFYQIDFHGTPLWVSKSYSHIESEIVDKQGESNANRRQQQVQNTSQGDVAFSELLSIINPERNYTVNQLLDFFNQKGFPLVYRYDYNAGADWGANAPATTLRWGSNIGKQSKLCIAGHPCIGIELTHFAPGWISEGDGVPRIVLITDNITTFNRLLKEAKTNGFSTSKPEVLSAEFSVFGEGKRCYKSINSIEQYILDWHERDGEYILEMCYDSGVDL